jgi:nicotinate dehydrogenase subunit B
MITRRKFLKAGAGAGLSIAFVMPIDFATAAVTVAAGDVARSRDAKLVNAWLDIDQHGKVTLHAGKVELGTGLQTAMAQLVAEELDVSMADVIVLMGDTATSVDQGATLGSLSLLTGAPPIRKAAATARAEIMARASMLLGVPATSLVAQAGYIYLIDDSNRRVAYKDLLPAGWAELAVNDTIVLKKATEFKVIGREAPRIELPAKVDGTHAYIHNLRLPGMAHARVVHPPYPGATLKNVDRNSVAKTPGLIAVVVKDNFVAVACKTEFQAIAASRALAIEWTLPASAAGSTAIYSDMAAQSVPLKVVRTKGDVRGILAAAAQSGQLHQSHQSQTVPNKLHKALYRTPFQTHGSIGPSCGVADVRKDSARIWSATQGSFPLRNALADLLHLPVERVRVIWQEGSGCYGHNGADDASAEAALLSQTLGMPVRVQWMRHDEHGWDPKGPAMEVEVQGALGADGVIQAWDCLISSPSHVSRPSGTANNLLPAQMLGAAPKPALIGAEHCAATLYQFPNENVAVRWLPRSLLRSSSLRGLGAFSNAFANESFIDELAASGNIDPIDLRKTHLTDPRAVAVLDDVRRLSQWDSKRKETNPGNSAVRHGTGFGFVRLDRGGAYVATVCCVDVDMQSGAIRVSKVYVSHDCGLIINPNGLRNQIEGCVIQSISRTLKEEVKFSGTVLQSLDWNTYPIIRFSEVPDQIVISLVNRPDQPVAGAGEPAAMTVAPAIASAVFHATGLRLRQIPFTAENFKSAKETNQRPA